MKTLLFTISICAFLITSCSRSGKIKSGEITPGCMQTTDRSGNPMLWGSCTGQSLQQKPYSEWYNAQFGSYAPDSLLCARIGEAMKNRHIKMDIFMGTWCGDSKRETPRMYKILALCNMPKENVRLFTVSNRDSSFKQTPGQESANAGIFRVPTFIFFGDDGKELGRIIESPVVSLERDMMAITGNEKYSPHYEKMNGLMQFCRNAPVDEFAKNISSEVDKIRDTTFAGYTLNNLIYVLMAGGKTEQAAALVRINASLFPGNVSAMSGEARYLRFMGKNAEAARCCRRILSKEPQNALAKEILQSLNM